MIGLLVLLTMEFVSGHPNIFFYPKDEKVKVPRDCERVLTPLSHKCNCNSDFCQFAYNASDIFGYLTFGWPQIIPQKISKYGYYINHGITNFKYVVDHTPTVTYALLDDFPYYVVEIIHIK